MGWECWCGESVWECKKCGIRVESSGMWNQGRNLSIAVEMI